MKSSSKLKYSERLSDFKVCIFSTEEDRKKASDLLTSYQLTKESLDQLMVENDKLVEHLTRNIEGEDLKQTLLQNTIEIKFKRSKLKELQDQINDLTGYSLHKFILSEKSEFFKAMFSNEMQEQNTGVCILPYADPEELYPLVIDFMYSRNIQITSNNAVGLLAFAQHQRITSLQQKAQEFITQNLGLNTNAMLFLKKTLLYEPVMLDQSFTVQEVCISYIERNFSYFSKQPQQFVGIPVDLLINILERVERINHCLYYSIYEQGIVIEFFLRNRRRS